MKIEKVAIIGAGAVGAYFIDGLREKLKDNMWIVAEGDRKIRLEKNGIVVNGVREILKVKTPEESKGADLVIVCVKYGALTEAADIVSRIVTENTIVLSPMNGVVSEEVIGSKIGMQHMVYSMIKIASQRIDNDIKYNPELTAGIFMGAVYGAGTKDMVDDISDLFEGTPVKYNILDDIIQGIWYKYALNISSNLPQAMIGCGHGAYFTSEYVKEIRERLCDEVIAVAKAKGIDIHDRDFAMGKNIYVNPKARFSTLQDLDAKRHTEIDMFSGELIKMARKLKVPTPYNEFTYMMIKALEEKNDGLI